MKKFLKENLGRIYMYKGLLVELVGYTDEYPDVVIVSAVYKRQGSALKLVSRGDSINNVTEKI